MVYRLFTDAKAHQVASGAGVWPEGLHTVAHALVAGARGLARARKRRRLQRAAVRDLNALDDRMLRDIGLYRGDIPRVARELAESATAAESAPERAAAERPRPAAGEPALVGCG